MPTGPAPLPLLEDDVEDVASGAEEEVEAFVDEADAEEDGLADAVEEEGSWRGKSMLDESWLSSDRARSRGRGARR